MPHRCSAKLCSKVFIRRSDLTKHEKGCLLVEQELESDFQNAKERAKHRAGNGERPTKRPRLLYKPKDYTPIFQENDTMGDGFNVDAPETRGQLAKTKPQPRRRKGPRKVVDILPVAIIGAFESHNRQSRSRPQPDGPEEGSASTTTFGEETGFWTVPNKFGITRRYLRKPSSIPDQDLQIEDLVNALDIGEWGMDLDDAQDIARDTDAWLQTQRQTPATNNNGDGSTNPQFVIPHNDNVNLPRIKRPASQTTARQKPSARQLQERILAIIHPHPNVSAFLLNSWFYRRGSMMKSKMDRDLLMTDVILNPAFNASELRPPFSFAALDRQLSTTEAYDTPESLGSDWKKQDVKIGIPRIGNHPASEWTVPGVYLRDITRVTEEVLRSPQSVRFNYDGYQEYWLKSSSIRERLRHEVYSTEAFLRAEAQLHASEPKKYTGPPRRIVGLMFWSDSTHLTSFGQAALHPIYMAFANQSKQERSQPNKRALHHIAYLPRLNSELITLLTWRLGRAPSPEFIAHLRQELFHAVWRLLLNEAFISFHKYGVKVCCSDNITRVLFARVMIYSADYPEKALIACIRDHGICACPNCLMRTALMDLLGTSKSQSFIINHPRIDNHDRRFRIRKARAFIYNDGATIRAAAVERELKDQSWNPTLSAFSHCLGPLNPPVDTFKMLANDRMHEWEGGIIKRVIGHLIRLLSSVDERLVDFLNTRFREMPSFGSRIRKFPAQFSGLQNLAARDYENAILCAMSAFSGLLGMLPGAMYLGEQEVILDLLYVMATFHTLSQLRLQTDDTLRALEDATVALGTHLRLFRETSAKSFKVKELDRDRQARIRRQNKKTSLQRPKPKSSATKADNTITLNLATVKTHLLGHYATTIREFGTMDSYSTELGEREHCFSKMRFNRTNRNRTTFVDGIAREETIERRIGDMQRQLEQLQEETFEDTEELSDNSSLHYSVANSSRNRLGLRSWLKENATDPAFKEFLPKLKNHLLGRLRSNDGRIDDDFPFTNEDHRNLWIKNEEIFEHQTMRVYYTSYDIRRDSDTITKLHPDIMLLSNDSGSDTSEAAQHPFWYARMIKIFHVMALDKAALQPVLNRLDVIWVRWFGLDTEWAGGAEKKRLLRLGFVPGQDDGFGFVNPEEVIRGCYLLPVRAMLRTRELLDPPSALASDHPEEGDYPLYDLVHWVDPDMYMRYSGGGPGHAGVPTCHTAWAISLPSSTIEAEKIVGKSVGEYYQVEVASEMDQTDSDEPDFDPYLTNSDVE